MTTKQEQIEQLTTDVQTRKHIDEVRRLLHIVTQKLVKRGEGHDASKLEDPEMEGFSKLMPELQDITYGSPEYDELLEKLEDTLKLHYAKNRHHPEHFPDGLNDMNLIDVVEMFCDWKAATLKHKDGNLLKSIEINAKRFKMNKQLAQVFQNTAADMDK